MASRLAREEPSLPPRPSYYDYRIPPQHAPHSHSKNRRASFPRHTPPLSPAGLSPYGQPPRVVDYEVHEGHWDIVRDSAAWPDYRPVDVERDSPVSRAASASRHYYDPWDDYYSRERPHSYYPPPPPPPPADPWYPPPPDDEYAPDYANHWEYRDVAPPRDTWGPYPPSRPLEDVASPIEPVYDYPPYPPDERRTSIGEPARDRSASFEPSESWKQAHSRSNSLRSPTAASPRFPSNASRRSRGGRDSWSSSSSWTRNRAASGSNPRDNGLPPRPDLPSRPVQGPSRAGPPSPSRRRSHSFRPSGSNGTLPLSSASLPPRPSSKPVSVYPPASPAQSTPRSPASNPRKRTEPASSATQSRRKSPGEISEEQDIDTPVRASSPPRTSEPRRDCDNDPDSIQSSRASSRAPAAPDPPKESTPPPPTRPLSRSSIASSRESVKPSTPPTKQAEEPRLEAKLDAPLHPDGALPTPIATEASAADISVDETASSKTALSEAVGMDAKASSVPTQDAVDLGEHESAVPETHADPRTPSSTVPSVAGDLQAAEVTAESDKMDIEPEPTTLLSMPLHIPASLDEVPELNDESTFEDGLRAAVMIHLLEEGQTRAERVETVLSANLAIPQPHVLSRIETSPKILVREIANPILDRPDDDGVTVTLNQRMESMHHMLSAKQKRLREEYLALNERWKRRCAKLDAQAREVAEPEIVHGRATRRNAALGDTIRSDLEMEQIIASLSVDDATNPDILSQRNRATIPDMISVTQGDLPYSYNDNNLRVYDPQEYYAPDTGIHDWTDEEKDIMMRQYALTPKQFGYIADKLENKTAEQCVDFYYLHKKALLDFRQAVNMYGPKKRGGRRAGKRKGNALLADIAQHDEQVREEVKGPIATRRSRRAQVIAMEARRTSARRAASQAETGTSATATPEPEVTGRATRRRKVPASKGPASTVKTAPPSAQPSRQPSPAPVPSEASQEMAQPDPQPSEEPAPQPESHEPAETSTAQEASPPPKEESHDATPQPPPVSAVAQSLLLPMIPAPKSTPPPPPPRPAPSTAPEEWYVTGPSYNKQPPLKRVRRPGKKYKKSVEIIDDDMEEAAVTKPLPPPSASAPPRQPEPIPWTDSDTASLLVLLQEHGVNFERIAEAMPGRSVAEVIYVCRNNVVLNSIAQSIAARTGVPHVKANPDAAAPAPAPSATPPTAAAPTIAPSAPVAPAPVAPAPVAVAPAPAAPAPVPPPAVSAPAPPPPLPPMSYGMYGGMPMQPGAIPMPPIPPYMQSPMYPPPPMHYARYPEYYPRDYWPPPPPFAAASAAYGGYPPVGASHAYGQPPPPPPSGPSATAPPPPTAGPPPPPPASAGPSTLS